MNLGGLAANLESGVPKLQHRSFSSDSLVWHMQYLCGMVWECSICYHLHCHLAEGFAITYERDKKIRYTGT